MDDRAGSASDLRPFSRVARTDAFSELRQPTFRSAPPKAAGRQPPIVRHSGFRASPFVREPIVDLVEVIAANEATTQIIQIQRYRTTLLVGPSYCLLHRSSFQRIIVHGQQWIAFRGLIGIVTTVVVLDSFNNRVHFPPAVRARALVYDVPQHGWFVALYRLAARSCYLKGMNGRADITARIAAVCYTGIIAAGVCFTLAWAGAIEQWRLDDLLDFAVVVLPPIPVCILCFQRDV